MAKRKKKVAAGGRAKKRKQRVAAGGRAKKRTRTA